MFVIPCNLVTLAVLPDSAQIRAKAAEVVARPDFQLDSQVDHESMGVWLRAIFWLLNKLRAFVDFLNSLPSPLWWMVVIGMTIICLLLIGHVVWTFAGLLSGNRRRKSGAVLTDSGVDADELERKANQAEANGDYIGAIRMLFRAGLVRIEKYQRKPIRRGITNWELLRRYRSSPFFEPLQSFVGTIDAKWYGHDDCVKDDCQLCRTEYVRICNLIEGRIHAVGS